MINKFSTSENESVEKPQPIAQIRWKRTMITVGLLYVATLGTVFAYDKWRVSQGWCVRFSPDGDREILYGEQCR